MINDAGMIKYRVSKGTGYVTETAIFSCGDVADILLGHRTRCIITMTLCTVINPASMIKGSVSKIHRIMAQAAILPVGRRMISCLPSGSSRNIIAIMTRGAITGDTRMIKDRRIKGIVSMTNITILARWQMACSFNN